MQTAHAPATPVETPSIAVTKMRRVIRQIEKSQPFPVTEGAGIPRMLYFVSSVMDEATLRVRRYNTSRRNIP